MADPTVFGGEPFNGVNLPPRDVRWSHALPNGLEFLWTSADGLDENGQKDQKKCIGTDPYRKRASLTLLMSLKENLLSEIIFSKGP